MWGVKEAVKIADAIKNPCNLDPNKMPDFVEAHDFYESSPAYEVRSALMFREGFKHGYRDKLRSALLE